jgi:hypothetical protein
MRGTSGKVAGTGDRRGKTPADSVKHVGIRPGTAQFSQFLINPYSTTPRQKIEEYPKRRNLDVDSSQ